MDSESYDIVKRSSIYDMLNQFGILSSTETKIHEMMNNSLPYGYTKIYNQVYNGTIYNKSYIYLPVKDLNKVELWFNGIYIYPDTCKIIGSISNMSVILLNDKYDDTFNVRYWINKNISDRFTYTKKYEGILNTYHLVYSKKDGITKNSFYAISDGVFKVPEIIEETTTGFNIQISYMSNIDIFVCKNLEYRGMVGKDQTILIGDRYKPLICGRYILNLINYPLLDVRFYPFIKSYEAGFLRVFSDMKIDVDESVLPYIRYINYPENVIIKDPYDVEEWDNARILFSEEVINSTDTEDEIFEKLDGLSKEYYRIIDLIKMKSNLFETFDSTFVDKKISIDGIIHNIKITNIPYNSNRDILYYNGTVFFDYSIGKIRDIDLEYCEFSEILGYPRLYIIDDANTYSSKEFSILKINSDNNTTIKNIANMAEEETSGKYNYFISLNKKIQTMYRNIMFLREYSDGFGEISEIILSTDPIDSYTGNSIWFEILSKDPSEFDVYLREILYDDTDPGAATNMANLWFKAQNSTPEEIYKEIIISNVVQDPVIKDKLLFNITSSETEINETKAFVGNLQDNTYLLENPDNTLPSGPEYVDTNDLSGENPTDMYLTETIPETLNNGDIYADWVDGEVTPHTLYLNPDIIICEVNSAVVKIGLKKSYDDEYVDMLIFEDLVLNFRKNEKKLNYNRILPDLLNNHIVSESDLLVFDGTLKDSRDRGYVHLENDSDSYNRITNSSTQSYPDMSLIYSTNMKRLSLYKDELDTIKRNELENKIINLNQFDVYFDKSTFLIYLNGKYVKKSDISIISKNKFIVNFLEDITRIDIIYDVLATDVYRLKNILS